MKASIFHFFAPLLLLLSLTGCYEDHSEIWLNTDGSGRMKSVIIFKGMGTSLSNQANLDLNTISAHQFIDDQEGITLISAETKTESPELTEDAEKLTDEEKEKLFEQIRIVHEVEYEFESLRSLGDLELFDAEKGSKRSGASVGVKMVWKPSDDDPTRMEWRSEISGPTATGIDGKKIFEGSTSVMKVHFPSKILDSNATSVSEDGKTATWEVKMNQIINDVAPLHATLQLDSSGIAWSRTSLTVLAILSGIILLVIVFWIGRVSGRKSGVPHDNA